MPQLRCEVRCDVGLVSVSPHSRIKSKVVEYGFPSQTWLEDLEGLVNFYVIYPNRVYLVMGLLLGLPSHFPEILSMTVM